MPAYAGEDISAGTGLCLILARPSSWHEALEEREDGAVGEVFKFLMFMITLIGLLYHRYVRK